MTIRCTLDSLGEFFKKEGLSFSIEKTSGDFPVDYLAVNMGEDDKGRTQIIELIPLAKAMPGTVADMTKLPPLEPNFLQIRYLFPFQFQKKTAGEIARYLLLINKTLDFIGFGMSEPDSTMFYRYDLYIKYTIEEELLKGMLGYILFIIDSIGPKIELLATEGASFKEILEEFI